MAYDDAYYQAEKKIEEALQAYEPIAAEAQKVAGMFKHLTAIEPGNKEQFNEVKSARIDLKNVRCAIENKRKELKADALEFGRKVDGKAKEKRKNLREMSLAEMDVFWEEAKEI